MSLLDQAQPGAQEQIDALRAQRREADAERQALRYSHLSGIAMGNNGVIPADEARRVAQEVTGEIPIPVIDVNAQPEQPAQLPTTELPPTS